MAYAAVDKNKDEWVYSEKPHKNKRDSSEVWSCNDDAVYLPKGSIEKLIGKKLTWEDEPVELEEE